MTSYDIYLSKNLNTSLDLQTMIRSVLQENNIHIAVEEDIPLAGFIGLEVSDILAKKIWEQLKSNGLRSVIAPSRYRQAPLLTIDEAHQYAALAVEQKKVQDPTDEYGELVYFQEDILWFTFRIFSKKLAEEKRTPSSLFINIDKIDGHLWKDIHEAMNVTLDTWFY